MNENTTAAPNVIPFRFEAREVRTLLIDDQPWFVATDVCQALAIVNTARAMSRLDDDEKGIHSVNTLGGTQNMSTLNESGLYSLILTSRKAEAKRFKKWVTAEVLPAIRKHGRYVDSDSRMTTLIGQTIGTDGFHCLAAVLDGKLRMLKGGAKRAAKNHIWQQVHRAFSVVRAEDIPAEQIDSARNFIAAYSVREGEWMPRKDAPEKPLDIELTVEKWISENPLLAKQHLQGEGSLLVTHDMLFGMDVLSPTLRLIGNLSRAGHNVDACRLEVMSMRHHLETLSRSLGDIQRQCGSTLQQGVRFKVGQGVAA